MVADAKRRAVGIKPEGHIRWLVIDVDAKQGRRSPYWDKLGRNLYLDQLRRLAEGAGCRTVLLRSSSSNGLHLWILLPDHQPAWLVHHIGMELAEGAGMHEVSASCELFPSLMPYVKGGPIPQSKGIRLPGGKGSALVIDGQFNSDPEAIYEALQQAVEATEINPRWETLVSNAHARGLAANAATWAHNKTYGKPKAELPGPWTARSQSNDLTREIIKVAMVEMAGQPDQAVIDHAIQLIQSHPGYWQHTSSDTKRDVANGSKVRGWLACLRKRLGQASINERPRNSSHNADQMARVRKQLMVVLQEHGAAALEQSQRWWHRVSGLGSIHTIRKWWDRLPELLQEVMHTPPIKALHRDEPETEPESTAVELDQINSMAVLIPPVTAVETEAVAVPVETEPGPSPSGVDLVEVLERCRARLKAGLLPVKAVPDQSGSNDVISARRAREREELERWLSG